METITLWNICFNSEAENIPQNKSLSVIVNEAAPTLSQIDLYRALCSLALGVCCPPSQMLKEIF